MKIACISDVHSNLEALQQAFETIAAHGADAVYCLGDVVGYGADASACVDLIREHCAGVVLGNHDAAVAMGRDLGKLPRDGQAAALHNRARLSDEQLGYLAGLPLRIDVDGCTFVHATPQAPEAWIRANSFMTLKEQFKYFDAEVCFIGHTHVPGIICDRIGVFKVKPGNRYLINVGSVGQPRDRNPRLGVGFFDTDTFAYDFVRVPYDVAAAASKIHAAGLPRSLADRLEKGE